MKKRILVLVLIPLLVLTLAGVSQAWQGRMGGMGDPYGLISDESDLLIHPAKIANGEGVLFYGNYRFTYTGVLNWDNEIDLFTAAGVLDEIFSKETSGDELRHEALVGSSFPLGPGRMGLFFQYSGKRGEYDGKQVELFLPALYIYDRYDLKSDLDNFAFRLLYGLPVGGFKLGGEVQFAYRQEENENWLQRADLSVSYLNNLFGDFPEQNLLRFQIPYDSRYWEALIKGSLDGKVGPLDLEFTLRGGFIFGGDNSLEIRRYIALPAAADLDGDVQGWRIGGDLWLRYPLAKDLVLPFLVRIDYQSKTRDGEGPGTVNWSTWNVSYESEETDFRLTVGGGVEKELGTGTKIAAGIYYNYLQGTYDSTIFYIPGYAYDNSDSPSSSEHQVMLRLAGEHELSPRVALRMGLNFFYGWVMEDFAFTFYNPNPSLSDDISLDGSHWGIGASVGGTIKFKPITLEPFINFNYQQSKLDGDGERTIPAGTVLNLWEMDKSRSEWSIGGGFSVLFGL